MTDRIPALPGLDMGAGASSFSEIPQVFVGDLYRFPDAVTAGMRRELQRLSWAGIPAFADGRRVWTPRGVFFIGLSGHPSRRLLSAAGFEKQARRAARRMATDSTYSFNRPFAERYLKEELSHA